MYAGDQVRLFLVISMMYTYALMYQIASFIVRFAGTVMGLLSACIEMIIFFNLFWNSDLILFIYPVGMTVWYIGAGLGHGNPYGVVIATVSPIPRSFYFQRADVDYRLSPWLRSFWQELQHLHRSCRSGS